MFLPFSSIRKCRFQDSTFIQFIEDTTRAFVSIPCNLSPEIAIANWNDTASLLFVLPRINFTCTISLINHNETCIYLLQLHMNYINNGWTRYKQETSENFKWTPRNVILFPEASDPWFPSNVLHHRRRSGISHDVLRVFAFGNYSRCYLKLKHVKSFMANPRRTHLTFSQQLLNIVQDVHLLTSV